MDAFVAAALEYYGEKGDLDATPVPAALERERDSRIAESPLRFPGKIATDLPGNRLFISDSSNHRWESSSSIASHSCAEIKRNDR